jgi:hypothetical protein
VTHGHLTQTQSLTTSSDLTNKMYEEKPTTQIIINNENQQFNIHTESDEDTFISSSFHTIEYNNNAQIPISSYPLNNMNNDNIQLDSNNNKASKLNLNTNGSSLILQQKELALLNKRKLNRENQLDSTPVVKKQRNNTFIFKKKN